MIHDGPTGGHFGLEKTLGKARLVGWWPSMIEDSKNWISASLTLSESFSRRATCSASRSVSASASRARINSRTLGPDSVLPKKSVRVPVLVDLSSKQRKSVKFTQKDVASRKTKSPLVRNPIASGTSRSKAKGKELKELLKILSG
ncbi:hypothetical protein BD770DRAFT_416946 [Pilaira anomala]|nr:hypothetical protein BD770DRAFT_416946 [Pilaira anomala]